MTRMWKRFDSDFPPDVFVIDPPKCGCTDCITGMASPLDTVSMKDLVEAWQSGMRVLDRS